MVPNRTLHLLPCLPLVLAADLVAVPESMVAEGHRAATRSAIDSGTATWTITRRVRGSRSTDLFGVNADRLRVRLLMSVTACRSNAATYRCGSTYANWSRHFR